MNHAPLTSSVESRVKAFLANPPFAVVGASTNRDKYGNKCLRCYLQHRLPAVGVNPRAEVIEGAPCYKDLAAIPPEHAPRAISVITPPSITEQVVLEAAALGIKHIWMQPGAESARAVALCEEHGIACIAGDACLLVALGFAER